MQNQKIIVDEGVRILSKKSSEIRIKRFKKFLTTKLFHRMKETRGNLSPWAWDFADDITGFIWIGFWNESENRQCDRIEEMRSCIAHLLTEVDKYRDCKKGL